MNLYACLYVPDFPAAVLLRGERNRQVPPLVIYTGTAPNCFVFAATQPARAGGVKEGMPLAEAAARFAGSHIAKSPPPKESSRDEGKGRGIRPYRLRPTALPRIERRGQGARDKGQGMSQGTACGDPTPGATETRSNETTEIRSNGSTEQRILPRDTEAEQQAQRELLELALTISPRVEDTAPGVIVVELTGLPDPYGAAGSFSHQAESLGLPANVAVSRNRFVALCAARTQAGVTHIYPGQEAGFLHPLPIDVLPLEPKERETFRRWGIHTVGELARLPKDSLVARFGTRGGQLAKLARGQEDSLLRAYESPAAFEESMDFEWQVAELEPLSFLLSRLLDSLCLKLQGQGLAAEQIQIALKLADGSRFERAVSLPSPLNDRMVLLSLLRLELTAHPPGEAIEGVKVAARPTPLRRVQFSLFEPALPSPEKLAVTLARLTNLVGRDRVGAPVVVDTHRPGAFDVAGFAPQAAGSRDKGIRRWTQIYTDEQEARGGTRNKRKNSRDKGQGIRDKTAGTKVKGQGTRQASTSGATEQRNNEPTAHGSRFTVHGLRLTAHGTIDRRSLAFRCFRPPPKAEVILRGKMPVCVNAGEIQGSVQTRAGPWKVRGEWWTAEGWQYEEWDVELRGRLYRICCELPTGGWFVAGTYD